ncbi:MAG TPA: ABC transporter permease subunit [Candidatus Methylacidiphilales bacterium]
MNPVLWLEFRVRLRERKLWILALLFLLLFGGIDLFTVIGSSWKNPETIPPSRIGMNLLGTNCATLMGLALILGWAIGAGRLTQEREQRTLTGLLNTPLTGSQIVLGKTGGGWALLLWYFSLTLPFFVFPWIWGGSEWGAALLAFVICAATGLVVAAVSIGLSGFFRRTTTSYVATGLLLLIWLLLLPILDALVHTPFDENQAPTALGTAFHYILLWHNPVAVLTVAMSGNDPNMPPLGAVLLDAGGVWLLLVLLCAAIGIRGLRRGLSEKL